MQAQDMPVKTNSHTLACYREGGHKNSFQFIVCLVEMKADGSDGFRSQFVFYLAFFFFTLFFFNVYLFSRQRET